MVASRAPVRSLRIALMLPAGALMLLGLAAGLLLLGVPLPLAAASLPDMHAPLLVFGFLGTLISLERAVALRAAWAYSAPLLLAGGCVLALGGLFTVGSLLVVAGMGVHVLHYAAIHRRQASTAVAIQILGAVCGLAAATAWSGGVRPPFLVPLFGCFLVLTIAGERLELARVWIGGKDAEGRLFAVALSLAALAVLTLTAPQLGVPALGIGTIALVVWLLRYDVARATSRSSGLPRYVGICLLIAYGWLGMAGAAWFLGGSRTEGPVYDAAVHAVFLGFVITMVMAHAPIILPAVLGVAIPYHPALYAPVALLQLALLTRIVGGDAWGSVEALRAGGIGAAVAMLGFAVTAVALAAARRVRPRIERNSRVTA